MGTRDQIFWDHMSYASSYASPQCTSGYLPVVENKFLQTDSQNCGLFYEQPLSAPFLIGPPELSPSFMSSLPKYRAIQPRATSTGSDAKNPIDTMQVKPRKRQRRPQDTSGESTQLETGVRIVSLANPENERFELSDRLTLPRNPRLTQGS
jgi:hypothetical protein